MTLPHPFRTLLLSLIDEQAEFLIVGGYAVMAHGYLRTTFDLDIWVRPEPENAHAVMRAATAAGVDLPMDAVLRLQTEKQVVRLGKQPTQVDLVTSIDGCTWSETYARREVINFDGIDLPFIGLEDLRQAKRAVGRHRDLDDLEHLS
jgi:predicted nucleotidyltransferase